MNKNDNHLEGIRKISENLQSPEWKSILTNEVTTGDKNGNQNVSTIIAQCCKPGPPCGPNECFPCKPK